MNYRTKLVLSVCLALSGTAVGCGNDDDANNAGADASAEHSGDHAGSGPKPSVKDAGHDSTDTNAGPMPEDELEHPDPTDQTEAREYNDDAGGGWLSMIEGAWDLPANTEGYRCVRFTLPQDVYVHEFRPMIPLGTHHTVLTVAQEAGEPDGISECGAGVNAPSGVFGSGVGTGDLVYPDGVAMHLRKGQQLVLNLHLFNASDKPLHGVSGTLFKTMDKDDVVNSAGSVLGGPVGFEIPVEQGYVQKGQCTMDQDGTIFAVIPHMHQLGVHLKAVLDSSIAGETVLYDGPYTFDEQFVRTVKEVQMKKGDVVRLECTYDNTTDHEVSFGDSSFDEMCFAAIFRYPEGGTFLCTQ